jgi:hypothetical protein
VAERSALETGLLGFAEEEEEDEDIDGDSEVYRRYAARLLLTDEPE